MDFNILHSVLKKEPKNFWYQYKESPRWNDSYLMLEWRREYKNKLLTNFSKYCADVSPHYCQQIVNLHLTIWKSIWQQCDYIFHIAGEFNHQPVKIWYLFDLEKQECVPIDIGTCSAAKDKNDRRPKDSQGTFKKLYHFIEAIWLSEFKNFISQS